MSSLDYCERAYYQGIRNRIPDQAAALRQLADICLELIEDLDLDRSSYAPWPGLDVRVITLRAAADRILDAIVRELGTEQ